MLKLSKEAKLDLYNLLRKENNSFGQSESQLGYLPFLNLVWNLRAMPSDDSRFDNAYDDIRQHTVNNNDWEEDYLFLDRLKLLENDEVYNKFLETVVKPLFRKTKDEIIKYVFLINPYLEKYNYALTVTYYEGDLPGYTINSKPEKDAPVDIQENNIVFFVIKNPNGRSDRRSSHERPTKFPSFVLSFNDGWNDYSAYTTFTLFYYNETGEDSKIGDIKIMKGDEMNTANSIPDFFTNLEDGFCSLGQDIGYYKKIKEQLGDKFESVLYALKDAAFFPDIHEKYERYTHFINSLTRGDDVERLLRVAKYELYGYDLSNLYSFKYSFTPRYANNSSEVFFEFETEKADQRDAINIPNRIYALIGKNGTGKTQLITSLPLKIAKKENDLFIPRAPLFSKVIAVSYSIFDKFEVPQKTSSFNYVYCGLRNENDEKINEETLVLRFHHTWEKISSLGRIDKWRNILLNFINENLIGEFLIEKASNTIKTSGNSYDVNIKGFEDVRIKMSSGQSIILYIISEIVANIRYDSLLLYDEPETHLHPNAISQLMNTIYELVDEFKSFCIIATHSPLVVRELLSKNVYVIDREEDSVSVRRIGLESFGENLTTLTDEVFGNKDIPKQYRKIIQQLKLEGKSYEQIISLLQFDDVPLSLNTRIYIKSQFVQNEEP